jgi:hypothetical protein
VQIAQGAIRAEAVELQRELWARDLAAYVDILPVRVAPEPGAVAREIEAWSEEILAHPPAPRLWAYVGAGVSGPAAAVEALGAGARTALVEPLPDAFGETARWVAGFDARMRMGFAPAPIAAARLVYDPGPAPPQARVLAAFFDEQAFTTALAYVAPEQAGSTPALLVPGVALIAARVFDPLRRAEERVATAGLPEGGTGRALRVPSSDWPVLTLFERPAAQPGLDLAPEEVEIARSRSLTAQEIIARHQEVRQRQDDRLERWTASGRIDLHFKLAQGGSTVDVSIDSHYFWERGGSLEWEQTSYYVNGNRVTWKNIPELPLIQPEKVLTLPLDLTLDRTYDYRLLGEERVDRRAAYVLEFRPADPDSPQSLYRGRVFIDRESFVLLKAALVQGELASPVLSNEEIDHYAEQAGPEGEPPFWLLSSIDGQQIWNAAGRSFVVRREVRFLSYEINPPREAFEAQRSRAYASENQMLRDTEQGFRYLERAPDGTRSVKERMDTSQLFAAAGAFKDHSQDRVLPLGGVNYFNYDLFGRDVQFNALFAGVFAFVTASRPELGATELDLTLDAALMAIRGSDEVFEGDTEVVEERIESRDQSLALRLGIPVGEFVKVSVVGAARFRQFFEDDEASERLEDGGAGLEFVLPQDHVEWSGRLQAVWNRRGYDLSANASVSRRSQWEAFGLRDPATGSFGHFANGAFLPDAGEALRERYSRWSVSGFREWYLPRFQKVRATVDWLDGADLDRFSRYRFGFFGDDRLSGFSGSGVRFDDGWIGRAGYSFNLFEVIRLDGSVERAWVRRDDDPAGRQAFTGVGLGANLIGPWKTVINVSYGRALQSDVADLEGEQEFLLLVFKLF